MGREEMSNHDLVLTRAKDLIVEKDAEIAKLKTELEEAREIIAEARDLIPSIPILQPEPGYPHIPEMVKYAKALLEIEPKTTGLVERARAFLDKAGK
jgi:hypothetical protein